MKKLSSSYKNNAMKNEIAVTIINQKYLGLLKNIIEILVQIFISKNKYLIINGSKKYCKPKKYFFSNVKSFKIYLQEKIFFTVLQTIKKN